MHVFTHQLHVIRSDDFVCYPSCVFMPLLVVDIQICSELVHCTNNTYIRKITLYGLLVKNPVYEVAIN